jgi:hypothetical protein
MCAGLMHHCIKIFGPCFFSLLHPSSGPDSFCRDIRQKTKFGGNNDHAKIVSAGSMDLRTVSAG